MLQAGVRFFDTAESYQSGGSEARIGNGDHALLSFSYHLTFLLKFMADIGQEIIQIFTDAFIKIMINSKDLSINPSKLKQESRKHTVDNWLNIQRGFTGGSGLLTGIWGGPWAYAAEVGDIAVLLRSISRGCFGIGYILQNSVNYEEDIILNPFRIDYEKLAIFEPMIIS